MKKAIGITLLTPIVVAGVIAAAYALYLLGGFLWPFAAILIGQFLLGLLAAIIGVAAVLGFIGGSGVLLLRAGRRGNNR